MPIIRSPLEPDFYKFTMGQLVFERHPTVSVTYAFRNRTVNVHLGRILDLGELREEFDHVRSLRYTNSELHYLRGTNEYGERMFSEPYLQFLKDLRLPQYELESVGDELRLEFGGTWAEGIYWETIALSIVNEVYYRTITRGLTRFERDAIRANGQLRLMEKIRILRKHPDIVFSDFGTRRRFSNDWQLYVDEVLRNELPEQFLGTSNTYAAMQLGLVPMGTSAHELSMVLAGITDGEDWLRRSQRQVVTEWWEAYDHGLSIFLPDTFGAEFFFGLLSGEELQNWKGFRWDSGDPFAFGERVIRLYEEHGVDPKMKLLVPSDGLDLPMILKLHAHFKGRIRVSYGWGTGLTNDLLDNTQQHGQWFGPLSLVVKPVQANGRNLVKLSDNLAKATGRPEDIKRYKQAAGYTGTNFEACKY
jgi:nicotinate phosphoribosyltransferase